MPDVYLTINEADSALLAEIAEGLEMRAALPQQVEILETYLGDIEFPAGARVLDVGCGTGAQSRTLIKRADVAEVVGADQATFLIERARELAAGLEGLTFMEASGDDLPFEAAEFDVIVAHTVLTHVADPEAVLAELSRVLRPGGTLAICDGDFSTMSAAIGDRDPLQACAESFIEHSVNDAWLMRRLARLVRAPVSRLEIAPVSRRAVRAATTSSKPKTRRRPPTGSAAAPTAWSKKAASAPILPPR